MAIVKQRLLAEREPLARFKLYFFVFWRRRLFNSHLGTSLQHQLAVYLILVGRINISHFSQLTLILELCLEKDMSHPLFFSFNFPTRLNTKALFAPLCVFSFILYSLLSRRLLKTALRGHNQLFSKECIACPGTSDKPLDICF